MLKTSQKSLEQGRLLVPTALEITWKRDKPILLLGMWCVKRNSRKVIEDCDYEILPPYGLESRKREDDHKYVRMLEEKLFPEFSAVLNSIHGTHFEERYWKILTGSWFRNTISLLVNRINTLQLATSKYENLSIIGHAGTSSYSLATLDSSDATWASNDDMWNHFLILEIIAVSQMGISVQHENFELSSENFSKVVPKQLRLKHTIIRNGLNFISRFFSRKKDALIISTYLSVKAELLLQLALHQAPKWLVSNGTSVECAISAELRLRGTKFFSRESKDSTEKVIRELIFKLIPVVFLEKYNELKKSSMKRGFPAQPKFIFSSNSFEYDEEFKVFCAEETLRKTPIIYGQHGNTYGTSKYYCPSIEEETCDKFLTWGWSLDPKKHIPVFMLRNLSLKLKRKNSPDKLLLIELYEDHRRNTWDSSFDYQLFLKTQIEFCETLRGDLYSHLQVRLSPHSNFFESGDKRFWNSYDPRIQLDEGNSAIYSLFEDSKLVVHSYDSTGILETLSMNIPTLAFWRNGLDHLNEYAKNDYQFLVSVGIIHFDPVSAARHLNSIWDDVDSWWESAEVQSAREAFCSKYAAKSKTPFRTLSQILSQAKNPS
jgi:putative transferase (TIGR04331 family)